jgi:hypothetical protein
MIVNDLLFLAQDRRWAEKQSLKARGPRRPRPLHASSTHVTRRCLAQERRHRDKHKSRKNRESRRLMGSSAQCLCRRRPFLLRQELSFRGQMRNRILGLIKRKLVLKAPTKNRQGKHQEAEGQQNSATTTRRIAKPRHHCLRCSRRSHCCLWFDQYKNYKVRLSLRRNGQEVQNPQVQKTPELQDGGCPRSRV